MVAVQRALVLLAKYPHPGQVKTRLAAGTASKAEAGLQDLLWGNKGQKVGPKRAFVLAADLFEAFLIDRFNAHRNRDYELVLAISQPEYCAAFRSITGEGVRCYLTAGENLGTMMANIFQTFLQTHQKVLISGSDFPYLAEEIIAAAFASLEHQDITLVPAYDGAYNLIGMAKFHPIFGLESWSSGTELEQTIALLERNQIRYGLLDQYRLLDVDTLEDLRILAHTLSRWQAPRTFNKLQDLRRRIDLDDG